ncbi:MAG: SDR family oxidoreductase [Armatimonadota bacterium]
MAVYTVTGGAGFIGSHIVRRLAEEGHFVRVLDNFSTGSKKNLIGLPERVTIIEGDVRDREIVSSAIHGADYVLHLAAQISVPVSVEKPVMNEEVNSGGTLNVLLAARDTGVKRVVLSSSCAIYGDNRDLPLKESSLPSPLSPYAITKLAGEHYCKAFYELYGLPTVALRYLNVFGPGQRPDSAYAAVIPKFTHAIVNGLAPTVYGDGKQTRDFIFVENVVDANLLACRSDKAVGRVMNIGSGVEISLSQLLEMLERLIGQKVTVSYGPPRVGDIVRSVGDISLARELMGFTCKVDFEEGLKMTYKYFINETI